MLTPNGHLLYLLLLANFISTSAAAARGQDSQQGQALAGNGGLAPRWRALSNNPRGQQATNLRPSSGRGPNVHRGQAIVRSEWGQSRRLLGPNSATRQMMFIPSFGARPAPGNSRRAAGEMNRPMRRSSRGSRFRRPDWLGRLQGGGEPIGGGQQGPSRDNIIVVNVLSGLF